MNPEEVYSKCAEYSEIKIPEDLHLLGISEISRINRDIRTVLNFTSKYQALALEALSKKKKKLAHAKHMVKAKTAEALKERKYYPEIKGYTERFKLIETEAEIELNITEVEAEVQEIHNLAQALKITYDSAKTAKEQLSAAIKSMGDEKLIAAQGGIHGPELAENIKM